MPKLRNHLKICGIMVLSTLLLSLADSTFQPIICILLVALYIIGIRVLWVSIVRDEQNVHRKRSVLKEGKSHQQSETKRAA